MKRTTIFNLIVLGLVLMFGVTGCKKTPKDPTKIPGYNQGIRGDKSSGMMDGGTMPPIETDSSTGSIAAADPSSLEGRTHNREMFAANTVHFELDSAAVKGSDASNLETVANYFKSSSAGDLIVEGYCDERGTEGYNLALGDKRANSLREYLVNLGVSPSRIHTVSFGEANPVDPGQNESAWAKNRRGEFIFVEPAK